MDYNIKEVVYYSSNYININSNIVININNSNITFKILKFLGKGTVGTVYLLEYQFDLNDTYLIPEDLNYCVIKISNDKCKYNLLDEVNIIKYYFSKYKINYKGYPVFYGKFDKLDKIGVIYPYLGYYNLDTIKSINYKIDFNMNLFIIKKITEQLLTFTNLIHCDIKSCNIVINFEDNKIIPNIIDFGLLKDVNHPHKIISTCYISSPESLLTNDYSICLDINDKIDYSKHDNFGLASIIINLFIRNTFWLLFVDYFRNVLNIKSNIILNKEGILFIYCWYRFYYNDINELEIKSLKKLIQRIEYRFIYLKDIKFMLFDDFFYNVLIPRLNEHSITKEHIPLLKDLLKKLMHFDYNKRINIKDVLEHPLIKLYTEI